MSLSFQLNRRQLLRSASLALSLTAMGAAFAIDGAELYPGERSLYAEAAKEGLVVSFDTGPEWANWKVLFREFKKRYPEVEMTYNDPSPPTGGHRLLLRSLGSRRRQKGRGRALQAHQLRQTA